MSVIVAVFNQDKYIGRCLRSLINQSLPSDSFEIIIVDDGSNDQTPYALSLFEGGFGVNVKILTNPKKPWIASINKPRYRRIQR